MPSQNVIDIARAELGNTEKPSGSNLNKYGEAYHWNGVPWCVIFLWWCFKEAGESSAFFGGAKTASCGTLFKWYKEQGLTVPFIDIRPGDIVILNFSGTSETQHCGLVEKIIDLDLGWIRTIEGNTSPGLEGSQYNGGCVALKARNMKNIIGVCRPMYKEEKKKDYEGHWAEEDIKWCIDHGILKGYEDGNIIPNGTVTRGELAVVARRICEFSLQIAAELEAKEIKREAQR